MKKTIAILLAVLMALSLVACAGDGGSDAADTTTAASADTTTAAAGQTEAETTAAADDVVIAMLPKFKGENYFDACKAGAEQAAADLGITLLYDGPSQDQATNQMQVDILEGWIAQGVDAIVVSPNDGNAIAATLDKATAAGIKVLTFDADANEESRLIYNQSVAADGAAKGLLDAAKSDLETKGYGPDHPVNIALVGSSGTDANQAAWIDSIKNYLTTDDYKWMVIANEDTDIIHPGTDETKVNDACATLIGRMGPDQDQIQCAIALTSMATPALGAQYDSAASKPDASKIALTGLATPNAIKTYIKDETNPLNTGVLWNCGDLGYMSISVAYQLVTGELKAGDTSVTYQQDGESVTKNIDDKGYCCLGDALVFDASNVDDYNY